VIFGIQITVKATLFIRHFLPRTNRAVRIHKQDPDCTGIVGAIIIIWGTHRQIRDAITIHITDSRNRTTETVIIIKVASKTAFILRYLPFLQDLALTIEEQYPDCTPIRAIVVSPGRTDSQVRRTITVEIIDRRKRTAEQIIVIQISVKITSIAGDLLFLVHFTVAIHEQYPDGTPVLAVIIIGSTHGQIRDTVSLQVAGVRNGAAEFIAGIEISIKTAAVRGDLLFVGYLDPGTAGAAAGIVGIIFRALKAIGTCEQQAGYDDQ
jgi:hypothetical protein